MKSMKPGGGGQFAKLKTALAKEGATSPGGLAAYIGRETYGNKKMASFSAKGRHRAALKRAGHPANYA